MLPFLEGGIFFMPEKFLQKKFIKKRVLIKIQEKFVNC